MTSSIMTPSQSGIIGEGGRKVLKTRVQMLGRFLMEPGDELSFEAATQLAERATSAKLRLRTQLTLFSAGLRLGERGIFASMPVEFIKYHRLSDLVAPGVQFPAILVLCVRDYDQRCVTVVQFKDETCLRVVVDVINRHRRALDEDVARLSDLHSNVGSLVVGGGGGGGGGVISRGPGGANWHLVAPESTGVNGSGRTTTDSVDQQHQQQQQQEQDWSEAAAAATPSASVLMDEDDYAIIRRSRTLWTGEIHEEESRRQQQQQQRSSGASRAEATRVETPPVLQQIWQQEWQHEQQQQQQQQQQQRRHYQKHSEQQQQHSRQHNWSFLRNSNGSSSGGGGAKLATVPDSQATDFEDVETAAVFETPDGPPTLLNELVRRGRNRRRDGDDNVGGTRFKEVPPEFVARAQVSSRRTSAADAAAVENGVADE